VGKLFRKVAIFEAICIVLATLYRIAQAVRWRADWTVPLVLIGGLIALFFVLPLYVLGKMVDEVKEQRQLINYLMVKVKEGSNDTPEAQARKKDPRVLFPDHWKCSCGRDNAGYVSTCACGKSKHEMDE
jgi:hypothetical protein